MRSRTETSIEAAIRVELDRMGVRYEAQRRLGPWTVDFLLPAARTVLEADGTYWHTRPDVAAKDARKDIWMAAHGYEIVHLPEVEIREDPGNVIRRRWTRWAKEHGQEPGPGALE